MKHLVSLGHRRIGFVRASLPVNCGLRRFRGYLDGLQECDCELSPERMVGPSVDSPTYATQEEGCEGMRKLLQLRPAPTAVFGRNDVVASGAMRAAREMGLRIPEDIAVAGFDNVPMSAYTTPPLTTINQPTSVLGRKAAEFVLDRIEGRAGGERRDLRLGCEVVVRQSTIGHVISARQGA